MEPLKQQLNNLSSEQRQLVELWMRRARGPEAPQSGLIPRRAATGAAPLSYSQERMWLLDQHDRDKAIFTMPMVVHLSGPLDIVSLWRSFAEIVRRHETLRTTFATRDRRLMQIINAAAALPLPLVDLQALAPDEREALAQRLATEQVEKLFDLAGDRLVRATLLRFGAQEHRLILTMHHLVSDGWSIGVLFRELVPLYEATVAGRASPLAELPIQYADFAVWQRQVLSERVLDTRLAEWQRRLANLPPSFGPRPAMYSAPAVRYPFKLSPQLSEALRALSQREGAFPFITLLTALKLVLARELGHDDIVVGISSANRDRVEIKPMIGFFANMLVLRTDLSGNPSFDEALRRVRDGFLEAYEHRDLPIEKLLDAIRHEHIEVVFNFIPNVSEPIDAARLDGVATRLVDVRLRGIHQFANLVLVMFDGAEGLYGSLSYKVNMFDADTIWQFAESYIEMLEKLVSAKR